MFCFFFLFLFFFSKNTIEKKLNNFQYLTLRLCNFLGLRDNDNDSNKNRKGQKLKMHHQRSIAITVRPLKKVNSKTGCVDKQTFYIKIPLGARSV